MYVAPVCARREYESAGVYSSSRLRPAVRGRVQRRFRKENVNGRCVLSLRTVRAIVATKRWFLRTIVNWIRCTGMAGVARGNNLGIVRHYH